MPKDWDLPGRVIVDKSEPNEVEEAFILQGVSPLRRNLVNAQKMKVFDVFCKTPDGWGIGIERKTWQDVVGSIIDGRGTEQSKKAYYSKHRVFEVIVGERIELQTGMSYQSINGFLSSLAAKYHIPVIPVADLEEFADLCLRLIEKCWKTPEISNKIRHLKSGAGDDINYYSDSYSMLESVDGLKYHKIKLFAQDERFNSIGKIAVATIEDLQEIKGIGKVLAEKVLNSIWNKIEV